MIECTECGSTDLRKKGQRNGLQRYRCNNCGAWTNDSIEGKIDPVVAQIAKRFTPDELRALAKGWGFSHSFAERPAITFSGDKFTFAHVTDTHIGEETFRDYLWTDFLEECERRNVQAIFHSGDIIEGMSNRPDQVYHLTDVGFSAQMDHAARLLDMSSIPIYAIDGNHDRWAIKSGGLFVGTELERRCEKLNFIGHDCGDVDINGTIWRLWHGEDNSSYATSYRMQKLIEAFTGGDKPHVLLAGHTHKYCKIFERNIWALSGGALSYQSSWMKSTRKACHTGFIIGEVVINDDEIVAFSDTFYPYYK